MKKVIIICLLLLTLGCQRKSIDSNKFKSIVRDNGYYVISTKNQFSSYDYIKEAYLARNDSINIEFYIMSDIDNTNAFYEYNRDIMDANRTNTSLYKEKNNKYTLTTTDKYMVISCIDTTCIYVDTDIKNKDKVNNILKKLGY